MKETNTHNEKPEVMRLSARFNISKDTLPTHWTFPQYGWNEGAQVLNLGRAFSILDRGEDLQDDWYSKGKYPYLFLIAHEGSDGHSRMGYPAITEDNLKAVYRIDRQMAESIARNSDIDNFQDEILKKAEKIDVSWVDPRNQEIKPFQDHNKKSLNDIMMGR